MVASGTGEARLDPGDAACSCESQQFGLPACLVKTKGGGRGATVPFAPFLPIHPFPLSVPLLPIHPFLPFLPQPPVNELPQRAPSTMSLNNSLPQTSLNALSTVVGPVRLGMPVAHSHRTVTRPSNPKGHARPSARSSQLGKSGLRTGGIHGQGAYRTTPRYILYVGTYCTVQLGPLRGCTVSRGLTWVGSALRSQHNMDRSSIGIQFQS